MIVLELPEPPTTNNLFFNARRNGGGRVRTPEYLNWQITAGMLIQKARQSAIDGPVAIEIQMRENGRRDLDGSLKAPIDLLVAHRLIPDDRCRYVRKIEASWSSDVDGCRVVVRPYLQIEGFTPIGSAAKSVVSRLADNVRGKQWRESER